jgi:beta-glucosidase
MTGRRAVLVTATVGSLFAVAVAGATDHRVSAPHDQKASGKGSARSHVAVAPVSRATDAGVSRRSVKAPQSKLYLDSSYSFAERAADLVSRMTVAERAAQTISSRAPAIPRLGISPYGWWNEALHGVSRSTITENANATTLNNTTSYPIDQSLGSSWDPELIHRVASEIGDEAREVSPENKLNLDFYSPTMNMQRDSRWGRNDETYGEDPFLVAKLVSQFVNGMEGKDVNGDLLPESDGFKKTLTTLKHYAANNSESNRRTGSADMEDRTLREYYVDAFRRIVEEADPGSVMSSYNSINANSPAFAGQTSAKTPPDPHNPSGAPTADDPYLIDELLRQTFGFKGYLTSDCDAVFEAVRSHRWTIPSWPSATFARPVNNTERNALAMSAGEDLDCNTGFRDNFGYLNQLPTAVDQEIPTLVNTFNVNDLDTSATRLFEARMSLGEWDEDVPWVTEARSRVPYGTWSNVNNNAITETPSRLALAREAGAKSIVLLENETKTRKDTTTGKLLPLQNILPATAPKVAVIGFVGNPPPANVYLGGYSSTQQAPSVAQPVAGQSNTITPYNGIRNAVLALHPDAQVDFIMGFTGAGTTTASLTTVDPAAITAAAGYDAVIVVVGTDGGTANEDTDRTAITLPAAQGSLISQVAAANPNTIAYMETIGPVDVTAFEGAVAGMLWSSYNGQRKGDAIADVLLGAHNPTGRTPSIWPLNVGQLQPTTDYDIYPHGGLPGRTHWFFDAPVRYPFGHGLSYSDFSYDNLEISDTTPDADDTVEVYVEVENTSAVDGTEVVELYATTPGAATELQRPIKRLRGFKKVAIAAGDTQPVTFSLKVADLAFFDDELGRWVLDPQYGIEIGRSAGDIQADHVIDVGGALTPKVDVLSVKATMGGDAARDVTTRTVFPEGVTVVSSNTVAMSDDTLYGYIRKGLSKPFPDGMTFEYASNRPGVVKVDGDGTIHTVSNGVATVTATVTHEGVSESAEFVVKVASELDAIKINGKPIGDVMPEGEFQPDRFVYDVIVPTDVTGVPQVSATAPNDDASVSVTQATAVPGVASIDIAGPDGVVRTYKVNFSRAAASDEFDGSALGAQWNVVRPNPDKTSVDSGKLTIEADTGDILNSTPTSAGPSNTASNIVLQPALGDWTIESKLDFSVAPRVPAQQGGIIAYDDDDNYVKLGWEWGTPLPAIPAPPTIPPTPVVPLPPQPQIALTIEDNRSGNTYPGFAQGSGPRAQVLATVPTAPLLGSDKTVWLRLVKAGARYRSYYSVDGASFVPLNETGASLRNVEVGVYAWNGATTTASDLDVGVDYFHVSGQTAPGAFPEPPAPPVTPPAGNPPAGNPPAGNATDITEPRLRLMSPAIQSLRRLRTRGLSFRIGVDEPVSLRVTVSGQLTSRRGARTSARGKLRRLARVNLRGVRAGETIVRLKPSASLRRILRRERRLPAKIEVRAEDAAGNVATRSKTLVFR